MARGYVKNRIRSGPAYQVTLRDVEEPEHKFRNLLVLDLKLDFHPQSDIEDYPDNTQEERTGTSQMFLGLSIDEVQAILRYLNTHGMFKSEWFQALSRGENV